MGKQDNKQNVLAKITGKRKIKHHLIQQMTAHNNGRVLLIPTGHLQKKNGHLSG
jgi:hypothetical protein